MAGYTLYWLNMNMHVENKYQIERTYLVQKKNLKNEKNQWKCCENCSVALIVNSWKKKSIIEPTTNLHGLYGRPTKI